MIVLWQMIFMRSKWILTALLLVGTEMRLFSQTVVSGSVMSSKKEPLPGASITLENTFFGATSAADGSFSFITTDTGRFRLIITLVGFKNYEKDIVLPGSSSGISIVLKEAITELQAITVAAGSFEANDKKRNTVLKPLDIVTTAGQQADIVAALKTLPGAQQVGETEGLFVRGGTGAETKVFIDGMMVSNPFYSSVPDIAQRGRFSPLLFKGTNFSSGGYSAQFGQGLSSALTLETHDLPERTETNIIASSAQLSVTRYQLNKTKKASIGATVTYNNLAPYYTAVKQNVNYSKAPEIINGELFGRAKTKKGMLKFYSYANYNIVGLSRPSLEAKGLQDNFNLSNKNLFSLLTYAGKLCNDWSVAAGVSLSYNKDRIDISTLAGNSNVFRFLPRITNSTAQTKAVFTKSLAGLNKLHFGAEYQNVKDEIEAKDSIPFIKRKDNYNALFAEADLYITTRLVTRLGVRYEHSSLINDRKLSPRISLAYKLKNNAQLSAAYGEFYQKPETNLLFRSIEIDFTKATHYLLNYQRIANGQTIRVELFHKTYKNLITFPANNLFALANSGDGYARGLEVFWRDKKTFKDFSYWVAYSYLDTKRKFLDYPIKAQPTFAANHTVNIVAKQWVEKITSIFSLTYTYASGRPYYNPNLSKEKFLSQRTISYNNVGLQVNHLRTIGKVNAVFIANVNNVIGNSQVFGYRYASQKNIEGFYNSEAITPPAKRFYFIGIYLSMGTDRRKEVLDN
jgi:outer membrane cobalamin receptor